MFPGSKLLVVECSPPQSKTVVLTLFTKRACSTWSMLRYSGKIVMDALLIDVNISPRERRKYAETDDEGLTFDQGVLRLIPRKTAFWKQNSVEADHVP